MRIRHSAFVIALVILALASLTPLVSGVNASTATSSANQIIDSYGKLPLSFEPNQGQARSEVRFLSQGHGYTLLLTQNEAVLALKPREGSSIIRMKLVDASSSAQITPLETLPGKANYFIGNDPAKWHTNVPTYSRVQYAGIYPGIDLVYYGNQRQLEYDFVVRPGSSPSAIALDFASSRISIDKNGDLLVETGASPLRFHKPQVYQTDDQGNKQYVDSRYEIASNHRVSFHIASYDRSRSLIIDPVLSYSTYLGATLTDVIKDVALDSSNNAYVTGQTFSSDFPTTAGAFDRTCGGCTTSSDDFVAKVSANGSSLVYSTYLGGSSVDSGLGIAVDSAGNAYVAGFTQSSDFPTTASAFQATFHGSQDATLTKVDPNGASLLYSTFLGGS